MKLILLLLLVNIFINQAIAQTFAVIGDYGKAGGNELAVANMVKGWSPDFIITVGDNNYDAGAASTIDENIGQYYHDYIKPYLGNTSLYGNGSPDINRFFPVPGNHDWDPGLTPYLDYFTLPGTGFSNSSGNERYYDFVWGDVHFFMIDSDALEPDGVLQTSTQALWVKNKMESSTAKWKIAVLHHPPYSSRGSSSDVQWPFNLWGADAVFAGHKHNYERFLVNGLVYFVNGLGGKSRQSFYSPPETGSKAQYWADYGAMLVVATSSNINFSFYNISGALIDSYEITNPTPVELAFFTGSLNGNNIDLRWRTETEVNNYGFDIERSTDNLDWYSVVFVEGNGNSNSPKYYNFSDNDINQSGTYYYRLKQIDNDGTYEYSDVASVEVGVPNNFYLSQNYSNPFNPETRIDFTLPEKHLVSLRIYNTLGEQVAELVNEERGAGSYSVTFDASTLPSGVYIYRLQTSSFAANMKMTFLK